MLLPLSTIPTPFYTTTEPIESVYCIHKQTLAVNTRVHVEKGYLSSTGSILCTRSIQNGSAFKNQFSVILTCISIGRPIEYENFKIKTILCDESGNNESICKL